MTHGSGAFVPTGPASLTARLASRLDCDPQ
jgi:hypothetical protein